MYFFVIVMVMFWDFRIFILLNKINGRLFFIFRILLLGVVSFIIFWFVFVIGFVYLFFIV